jgi:hypothetical protein
MALSSFSSFRIFSKSVFLQLKRAAYDRGLKLVLPSSYVNMNTMADIESNFRFSICTVTRWFVRNYFVLHKCRCHCSLTMILRAAYYFPVHKRPRLFYTNE